MLNYDELLVQNIKVNDKSIPMCKLKDLDYNVLAEINIQNLLQPTIFAGKLDINEINKGWE